MGLLSRIGGLCGFGDEQEADKAGDQKNATDAPGFKDLAGSFDEHQMSTDKLAQRFAASGINVNEPKASRGLSTSEAERLLLEHGPNALDPPKEMSDLELFLRQFLNMFWVLLLGASVLCFLTFGLDTSQTLNLYVGGFLIVMVFVMCCVSFFEEKKGRAVVRAFSGLLPTTCVVMREGTERVIPPEQLVLGDIVIVRNGTRVPADMRVLYCSDFKLESSSITGEAEPIEYVSTAVTTNIFEGYNVGFNGSYCVDGEGVGVVIRTGKNTIIGQIATLTTSQATGKCSLELEIERFVKFVTVMAIIMAVCFFLAGCITNNFKDVLHIFINGFLVVIIANVPQGLPATVTTQLTIIARRMAQKNVFLKKLEVIESFGATTVIASDKTGTLTKNQMTVVGLWVNQKYVTGRPEMTRRMTRRYTRAAGDGEGQLPINSFDAPFRDLLEVMTICNKARVEYDHSTPHDNGAFEDEEAAMRTPAGKPLVNFIGQPSEVAMIRYAHGLVDVDEVREDYNVVFEIPFNSVRKWHLVIVRESDADEPEGQFLLMVKGAPEVLVHKCEKLAKDSGATVINAEIQQDFMDAYDNFAAEGRRVIGCATLRFTAPTSTVFSAKEENFPTKGWVFAGLIAIMDPPRDDTAAAIASCKKAGIKVFMVTGDHPTTAAAIARQIGLIGEQERADAGNNLVVHGSQLPHMSDQAWDDLLRNSYIVFARTTPEHKLRIVQECQKRGEIVTVTGDGVNDAPALKRADVGVAMGQAGSDVAKQAADILLLDDNFASIVAGIEEGRLLFDNLRKTIAYTLTHLWPELIPIVLNFFAGFPMALTAVQILSIDLATDIPPAVSLAYETPEKDIMDKPPRKKGTRMVSKGLLVYSYIISATFVSIGAVLAYLYVYWHHDITPRDLAHTTKDYWKEDTDKNFTTHGGKVFTPKEQRDVAAQAAAAFHLTIVVSQAFHVFNCLTRRVSLFQHGVKNAIAILAVIIDAALICLFIFTPGVQYVFGAKPPPYPAWFFPVGVGIALTVFNEIRKFSIRRAPQNRIVRWLKW